ncbi:S49 family peptidase [Sneathiella marina]|uniref:S49 family peptidase n=1 Tax=Sneathiella marina TaxID=2950108 RepID=A0ABY4WAI5_9PROT|nr:S49 family peptidase [Sneathiella marina]
MASGGYWLGLCADEIYVNQNSVVGSIGVVSAGFGFTAFAGKGGCERRAYSAGENKMKLDPFSPEKEEDVVWLKKSKRKSMKVLKILSKPAR